MIDVDIAGAMCFGSFLFGFLFALISIKAH
jgi:hypothetical protein